MREPEIIRSVVDHGQTFARLSNDVTFTTTIVWHGDPATRFQRADQVTIDVERTSPNVLAERLAQGVEKARRLIANSPGQHPERRASSEHTEPRPG